MLVFLFYKRDNMFTSIKNILCLFKILNNYLELNNSYIILFLVSYINVYTRVSLFYLTIIEIGFKIRFIIMKQNDSI